MIIRIHLLASFLLLFSMVVGVAEGIDLNSDLDAASTSHGQRADKMLERREERQNNWANRDKSKDVCFMLPSGSDAHYACMEMPAVVKDKRAQNILYGYCGSLGPSSKMNRALEFVCYEGKKGCGIINDSNAAYWCDQCGGTRKWLAVYSLGHVIQCHR
jgi:hypothetical protein